MTAHNTGTAYEPAARHDWMTDALCTQVDPELWFPEKGGDASAARRICAQCPVAAQCAELALANGERFGIWAGIGARQLSRLRGAA